MPEPASRRAREQLPRIAGVVVLVAYAALVASVRSFTWPALVLTAIAGIAVLGFAARSQPDPRRPRPRRRGLVLWAILAVAVAAWELLAFVQSPRGDHPTISSILDAGDAHRPLRAALFLGWIALGRELARR
ncbi:MAG: hypothetical protein ACT4PI_06825 [Actinomycetota bacterium]